MFKKTTLYFLGIVLLLIIPEVTTLAYGQTTVFGPETYTRDTGKPQRVVKNFSANIGEVPFALSIKNGDEKRQRVASAVIEINGQRIINPEDFSKEISEITAPVELKAQNEIAVEVRGEPGSFITVTIFGNSRREVAGYAEPDYINLSIDTTVTILAFLKKANPTSINLAQYDNKYMPIADLGILYDDGTHGDRKAGDNDFTTQITINKSFQEMLYYRVSAFYKNNGILKKVLSNFFSVNAAHIPSVTGIVSPQGGTITLEGYASVTFPAGAFNSNTTVKVIATFSPKKQETYRHSVSIFEGGPHLSYEIRINSGYIEPEPAASFDMVLNLPDSFINTLPTNTDIQVFVQIDQGDIDNFELFDSTFDPITKTIRATLPANAFANHRHWEDKSYEVVVIVGTTPR